MSEPLYVVRLRGTNAKGETVRGSGVIVRTDGAVLTCHHVVDGVDDVHVDLPYPYSKPVLYEAREPADGVDLALIMPAVPVTEAIPIASPDLEWFKRVKKSDAVAAWGYSSAKFETRQYIAAAIRAFDNAGGSIGLSADINFGDSGGALLTSDEKLIAIISSKDTNNDGIALALPVTRAPRHWFASPATASLPAVSEFFVGRDVEVQKAIGYFDQGRQLVTLFGLGGIGKSECSRAIMHAAVGHAWADDGVRYADLQSARSAAEIVALLRAALNLPVQMKDESLPQALAGSVLYVLDDVYQAIAADGKATRRLIKSLVESARPARFLVTCRSAIGLGVMEVTMPLGRLEPPLDRQLFDRLCERYGYVRGKKDDDRVTELLRDLDGYPLCITIAANLLQDSTLESLLERWHEKGPAALRIPGIDEEDLDQLTSVDYSLALSFNELDDDAKELFGTFSLLPAGATPDLIRSIAGAASDETLQVLGRRALLNRKDERYSMLVPVREFASRTHTAEQRADAVAKIDRYFIEQARLQWEPAEAWRSRRRETIAAITTELPNIQAAVDRALERNDHAVAGALISGISEYYVAALNAESATRLEQGVSSATRAGDEHAEATIRAALGTIYWVRDQYAESLASFERAKEIFVKLGDKHGEADCLWSIAGNHWMNDEYTEARALNVRALALYEEIGDRGGQAKAIQSIGDCDRGEEKLEEARQRYEESLAIFVEIGHADGEASSRRHLGDVCLEQGKLDEAERYYEASLKLFESLDHPMGTAHALRSLGEVALKRKDYAGAISLFERASAPYLRIGDRFDAATTMWRMSEAAEALPDVPRAIALMEEIVKIYTAIKVPEEAEAKQRLEELRGK